MGLDPGAIQAVSAASGVWRADGCLQGFYRSKLTRSQEQHDSGLIQTRRNTQRWNDDVKLELQHLAAATPAGTSLEEAASVSQQQWGTRKQLVVFFGNAGIGTRGGWGAKTVLQACRKVVERANIGKPTARLPGKVVTVDEFRTSREHHQGDDNTLTLMRRFLAKKDAPVADAAVHAAAPCQLTRAKVAPSSGHVAAAPPVVHVVRDRWDDLEALPPIGKEYQQRYKLVNDRLPKGRQWLHRAAEYRRGIDGRARNNA
ncbi:hypothetical protein QJQ45_004557 [Haematococcus lacustris]|nr:hypothetical protein QJQ45_004557 [Haematococcus lacustris]